MSGFRLFCFNQFFKVHLFCLLMMVIFRLFMGVRLGFLLWIVLIVSTICSGIYLCLKPYMITKDIYAIMAICSCFSFSIIAQRFLWIALRIDLANIMYFLLSMSVFATVIMVVKKRKRKKRKVKKEVHVATYIRYLAWGFLLFLFFYQLILSYLLRPNFLTVLALSVSHLNLLLIIWTYFDVRKLYRGK